jgi:NADH-quinone oxidoreductase subunit J
MSGDLIIFAVSATVAVFGAVMMIAQKNPVASVLFLILSLLAQAVCYVQLGALFLGAVLVVVYAGAIMVLFLFVIMLLNLRGREDLGMPLHPMKAFTKFLLTALLGLELILIVKSVFMSSAASGMMTKPADDFGSVTQVARLLFTKYMYPFQLTGVLLLVALVGAVVLARRDRSEIIYGEPTDDSVSDPTSEKAGR